MRSANPGAMTEALYGELAQAGYLPREATVEASGRTPDRAAFNLANNLREGFNNVVSLSCDENAVALLEAVMSRLTAEKAHFLEINETRE
jgi:hypothetical protein